MRVKLELACPGVQDGSDAKVGTKPRRVTAEGEQGLRGSLEEELEDPAPNAVSERSQRGGQGEDNVKVMRRQQPGDALLDPPCLA
jgi:hypothetical protein